MTMPPPPPLDHCIGCTSKLNCGAYDRCLRWMPAEPRLYRLTAGDLFDRAFGWACLGFALGWIACGMVR